MNLFTTGAHNAELELRYKLASHPGVPKFGGWMHETFTANYNDALNLMNATGLDIQDAITQVQRVQPMWGYYINLQQEITDDLGAFAHWSPERRPDDIFGLHRHLFERVGRRVDQGEALGPARARFWPRNRRLGCIDTQWKESFVLFR
jgi:hypothetical protein